MSNVIVSSRKDTVEMMIVDWLTISENRKQYNLVKDDIKMTREVSKNKFSSTDDKTLRLGLKIPVGLYTYLNNNFRKRFGEQLIASQKDLVWFMKNFPEFTVPEEV